jgi:glutamate--cysteine ligase
LQGVHHEPEEDGLTMPAPTRSLTLDAVHQFIEERIFSPAGAGAVGIELEWFPPPRTTPDRLRALLPDPLPGGSAVTFEPGGQLELSGPPQRGIANACTRMRADTAAARTALAMHGIELEGIGLDPRGARPRVIDSTRYRAMEDYFDTRWPLGRTMMRNTAAVQVNLDAGTTPDAVNARWNRAHELGPTLAATFANSPFDALGRATGWRSARLAVWAAIDPSRTGSANRRGATAATSYSTYALDAPVMMIKASPTHSVGMRATIPFSCWLEDGHELGWPTIDDFEYHLTTLFPPVRPRGWLELRMIDALQEEWWPVAVAVTTALLDDPAASEEAAAAVAPVRDSWTAAARDSLAVPALHAAAERCFVAAFDAFDRLDVDTDTVNATAAFHDRYVARGRCPADDRLDNQAAHASTVA